jgi:unsaturated rhamnogalacturonyl hydrolase
MKTLALLLLITATTQAQTPAQNPATVERAAAGDSPTNLGPMATNLSPALTHKDIRAAMKKVAGWQLNVAGLTGTQTPRYNQQWTYAALYDGLLAYSKQTGDPSAHDAVQRMADHFQWQLLDTRFPHADDEALGQAYLDLYAEHPDPTRIAATRAILDRLVARADDPAKPVWWWCDALFMAPPVLVRMSKITGDHKYIDYMNHEWDITAALLYNNTDHLYLRDDRFLDLARQHEANGKPIYWSRGDGWVVAALVNLLEYLPANDPARSKYTQQLRDMLTKVASLQPADGLWRTGLLDPEAYKNPEVSGSAFFTFAMAYAINHDILDRKTFEPVVKKSWAAMISHIYADGRLGSIQPIGFAPDQFDPSSSYVYGVGGFLLAGSELDRMVKH